MGDPFKNLSGDLIGRFPALKQFSDYVETHQGSAPDPQKIYFNLSGSKNNPSLDLHYVEAGCVQGQACRSFSGRLNIRHQTLQMRHGWGVLDRDVLGNLVVPRNQGGGGAESQLDWVDEGHPRRIQKSCDTFHDLGGSPAAEISCLNLQDQLIQDFAQNSVYGGASLMALWSWDLWTRVLPPQKRWPITRFVGRNLSLVGTQEVAPLTRLQQTAPGLIAGGVAMAGAHALADGLGWDPLLHREERFKLGVLAGHGANRLVAWEQNAHRLIPHPATLLGPNPPRLQAARNFPHVRPMSLGAGLLSAALVDATLGSAFEEGSTEREVLRGSGFFLPQVYRGVMGSRTLSLATRPKVAAAGKWAGRLAVTAFVGDLLHSAYQWFRAGKEGMARDHRILQRAHEIREYEEGSSLWRGVLHMLAPGLSERYLISDQYVEAARKELLPEVKAIEDHATAYLRHDLIQGDSGANRSLSFYTDLELAAFTGERELSTVELPDGVQVPVERVAEHMGDENIYQTHLEDRTAEERIAYIQEQFSGWELSPGDVQAIYGQITRSRVARQVAELTILADPRETPFAAFFDETAQVKAGQESGLLRHLFPELKDMDTESLTQEILAARRLALKIRIQHLETALRETQENILDPQARRNLKTLKRDLQTYQEISRQLDAID